MSKQCVDICAELEKWMGLLALDRSGAQDIARESGGSTHAGASTKDRYIKRPLKLGTQYYVRVVGGGSTSLSACDDSHMVFATSTEPGQLSGASPFSDRMWRSLKPDV
jgi:hypothetical protein